jgi:hypothetical protein
MATLQRRSLGLGGQVFPRVRPHGLQLPVTGLTFCAHLGHQERLVDQLLHQLRHLGARQLVVGADLLSRVRRTASSENREPVAQGSLWRTQQPVAPRDGRPKGLLASWCDLATAPQQLEAVVEPAEDLLARHRPRVGRGELDRERHPVEPLADCLDDLGRASIQRARLARPLGKQLNRRPHRQRRHPEDRLAWQVERLPGGGEHLQPGAARQQGVGE